MNYHKTETVYHSKVQNFKNDVLKPTNHQYLHKLSEETLLTFFENAFLHNLS